MERGTWNVEGGMWKVERGMWNVECAPAARGIGDGGWEIGDRGSGMGKTSGLWLNCALCIMNCAL